MSASREDQSLRRTDPNWSGLAGPDIELDTNSVDSGAPIERRQDCCNA
jgi:hypothetical protein